MATKTFEELKQMAIQIRDEKANKQNTATRIGTQMIEHLNKLEQEYYNKDNIDTKTEEIKNSKQDNLTFDETPTLDSPNPVTSGGVRVALDMQKAEVDAAKDEALQAIEENEQSAISNFNAQRVTPEMLSESTKQLIEASGGGTIINFADDEDITSVDDGTGSNVLKLANRAYNPSNFSGKGYKILRKNIQEVSVPKFDLTITNGCTTDGDISITIGSNTTTISVTTSNSTAESVAELIASSISGSSVSGAVISFSSEPSVVYNSTGVQGTVVDSSYTENRNILIQDMINEPNTVYEIKYDFDLNGTEITLPEGCTLKFDGGSFKNGVVNGNSTKIQVIGVYEILHNILLQNHWVGYISDLYFYYNEKQHYNIVSSLFKFETVEFSRSVYYLERWETIEMNIGNIHIKGNNTTFFVTRNKGTYHSSQWGDTYDTYKLFTNEGANDEATIRISGINIVDNLSVSNDENFGEDISIQKILVLCVFWKIIAVG